MNAIPPALGFDADHDNNLPTDLPPEIAFGILKATQGASFRDNLFLSRLSWLSKRGLKTGAYHFATAEDVTAQVGNFLNLVQGFYHPDKLALDWEDNGNNTMSEDQAAEFVLRVFTVTGKKVLIYGSDLITESHAAAFSDGVFAKHSDLWLCHPINGKGLPPAGVWPNVKLASWPQGAALWQFSDDGPEFCAPSYTDRFNGADWNLSSPGYLAAW